MSTTPLRLVVVGLALLLGLASPLYQVAAEAPPSSRTSSASSMPASSASRSAPGTPRP